MFVKVLIVIFAFLASYLFYYQVLKPEVFDPSCITNTNNCINIEYYKYKNTVYGNVLPSGYSFWFNGDKIFVYGINNSKQCENQEVYEPAYAIDPANGNPLYYECIERAGNVKDKYIKTTLDEIIANNEDQDFFSAIKVCKKKRIGPSRDENNRPLFYKKDIGILARSGFDFDTSKRVMDLEKSEYLKIINLL